MPRGETDHAPTLLLRERPGAVEHPRLAGSGVSLDPDGAVLLGENEPHRLFLTGRERSVSQMPVDYPASHRRLSAARAGPHQRNRFAFLGYRLVGGEPVTSLEGRSVVQPPLPLEFAHRPLDRLDRRGTHVSASASLSTSRLWARVISATRLARCWFSAVEPGPRPSIAASISARRVEKASMISRETPAISNRPSAWVFSIPYPNEVSSRASSPR